MREIEEITIYDVDAFVREVVPPLGFQRHPIYRGQADSRWSVVPGLMREDLAKTEFSKWGEFETSLLWKFKQQTMGTIGAEPHSELEWISIAQDAGLPTRFTSWTEDALTALYFACQDSPGLGDGDGAVYRILCPPFISRILTLILPLQLRLWILPFTPTHSLSKTYGTKTVQGIFGRAVARCFYST